MVKTESKQELFVFWNYHNGSFETLLGGYVDRFDDNGRAYVPSYQMWVKPIAIFPESAVKEIRNKIKELEKEFFDKKSKLLTEYKEKINSLIK